MRASYLAAAAGAAVLLLAGPASANGRFPASNQFVFSPTDPNLILLRATYGILPSKDNGASWSFLCEDALGLPSNGYEDPSIGLTASGALIAGVSLGMNVSTDLGCNWSCQMGNLAGQGIADIAIHPEDASKAVALTSTYVMSDSGTNDTLSQVFQTVDNGMTWTALGPPIDSTVIVQTVDVPKSDPTRVYVSGTRNFGVMKRASLFVLAGGSNAWVEQPIAEFDPTMEDSIYIAAIDPTNADRVYLRTSGLAEGGESRLFVTSNASSATGATFVLPMSGSFQVPSAGLALVGELLGFALSADASKVYLGTKESGLWEASTSDFAFHQTNSHIKVQCLATRGSELWACSDAPSGFIAGVSTDDGATFTSKLCSVTGLTGTAACAPNPNGPSACMATGNSSQCGASFDMLCMLDSLDEQCMPCGSGDAGSAEGGTSSSPPPKKSSSCGFSASAASTGGAGGAAGALVIAAFALQRRRRARRGRSER